MAFARPIRRGQTLAAAHAGHHAELDLGLAELGGVGRDDEIAHHGELAAPAQGKARNSGDHGLATARHPVPADEEIIHIGVGIGELGHFLDVRTCREGLVGSCDHDAADVTVGVERVQSLVDLAAEASS